MTRADLDYLDSLQPGSFEPSSAAFMGTPRVQITDAQGRMVDRVPLTPSGLTVGRQPGNAIVLDDPLVSRNHVRISTDGSHVYVIDLGSRCGTTVAGVALQPQQPQRWEWWQHIKVSSYDLCLEPPTTDLQPVAVPAIARIGIQVTPTLLELVPGLPNDVHVTLSNQGTSVDELRITVEGIPSSWVSLPSQAMQLDGNRQVLVSLTVTVPVTAASVAKTYDVAVIAHSRLDPADSDRAEAHWTVRPFIGGALQLKPKKARGRRRAQYSVYITNTGNSETRYTLSFDSEGQDVAYDLDQHHVTIAPGMRQAVRLIVEADNQYTSNAEESYHFTVRAVARDTHVWSVQGEFVQPARVPIWIVALAIVALALLLCPGILVYRAMGRAKPLSTAMSDRASGGDSLPMLDATALIDTRVAQLSEAVVQTASADTGHEGISNPTLSSHSSEAGGLENQGDPSHTPLSDTSGTAGSAAVATSPADQTSAAGAAPQTNAPGVAGAAAAGSSPAAPAAPQTNAPGAAGAVAGASSADQAPAAPPDAGAASTNPTVAAGAAPHTNAPGAAPAADAENPSPSQTPISGGAPQITSIPTATLGLTPSSPAILTSTRTKLSPSITLTSTPTVPTVTPSNTATATRTLPVVSVSPNSTANEADGAMTFQVKLNTPSDKDMTLSYYTSNGTAVSSLDYVGVSENSIILPAGATSARIQIQIIEDTIDEGDEQFYLTVYSNDAVIGFDDKVTGTIVDNDGEPRLMIQDASAKAGEQLVFTINLIGSSSKPILVAYSIIEDSAKQGRDYDGTVVPVSIAPYANTAAIIVTSKDDGSPHTPLQLSIVLTYASGAQIVQGRAIGTITVGTKPTSTRTSTSTPTSTPTPTP